MCVWVVHVKSSSYVLSNTVEAVREECNVALRLFFYCRNRAFLREGRGLPSVVP